MDIAFRGSAVAASFAVFAYKSVVTEWDAVKNHPIYHKK
jgi:hypothetical protein